MVLICIHFKICKMCIMGLSCLICKKITQLFQDHIKNCVLCKAKGFVCEICNSDDGVILFPFDKVLAAMCVQCEGAFHKRCYKQLTQDQQKECVRCVRLREKKAKKIAIKSSILMA